MAMREGKGGRGGPAKQKITATQKHLKTRKGPLSTQLTRSLDFLPSRSLGSARSPLSLYILSIDRSDHTSPERADTVSRSGVSTPILEESSETRLEGVEIEP